MTTKYERFELRLSSEDKEALIAMAEQEGMSLSDLVREKVLKANHGTASQKDLGMANLTIMTYAIANRLAKKDLAAEEITECLQTAKGIAEQLNISFAFNGE
jgi:hypothetical protein